MSLFVRYSDDGYPLPPLPEVIPGESCDRCGSPARQHVYVPFSHGRHGKRQLGELYFCQHDYDLALPGLVTRGWR